MAKKENVSNRHAQERLNQLLEFISGYGMKGVEEQYLLASQAYHHGIAIRKTKQDLSILLWMDRIRREGGPEERVVGEREKKVFYFSTNKEEFRRTEQVNLSGEPTTTQTASEEGTVLDIIARAHTTSPKVVNQKEDAEK